ncbi:MAG: translation initiation factor IF-2 [Coleofasciculaceae cyanobacterium]
MNNGKVRIYELSRELNLDNKDILNICEGLNISVKSHSSTITESEAERIRSAAEKYSDRPAAVKSRENAVADGGPRPPANNNKLMNGSPNGQRKQQILEIRKPKPRPSSSQQGSQNLSTPPQLPVKPAVSPPNKPTTPSRPTRVNQQERPESEIPEASSPQPVVEVEKPQRPDQKQEPQLIETLVEPPVRPSRPKTQVSQVERPIIKKNRSESAVSGSSAPAPVRPSSNQATAPDGTREKPRGPSRPSVPALQAPPTRRAPIRDGQKSEGVRSGRGMDDGAEGDDTILETPDLLTLKEPRRPAALRPVKKKTEWEEENGEEEGSKAGKKVKRKAAVFLDEDEDIDDLDGIDLPVTVSASVARPPRPKSLPGQVAVAAAMPNLNQRKKPGAKGSRVSKSELRDQRREKNAGPQRPEKIVLTGSLSIRELATALVVPETEIIRKLFFKGMAVSITQTLDIPTASMVAEELGVEVETAEEEAPATKVTEMLDAGDMESLQRRPPVVTIMGHVDHGKTTLLDAIRQTKVAQGEAGGITQHIGAYHVDVEHEGEMQQVVFLDTPGHEAFTAMRARGARVTDIAILVVAADDGVRPQTIEAISHAKAAGVPIIVAINKIDKAGAQPDRVKNELTEQGLQPEEWGGDTIMVPVSAIQKENLDTLLDMILLVAEVEDLQANPDRLARGSVIEANLDKARGPVATLLVQNGTLQVGDSLVAGSVFGKVRAMIDDQGAKVEAAGPSFAVELLGLSDVPAAGDEFEVFASEKEARATANTRTDEQRQSRLQQVMASRRVTLNSLSAQAQEGELKELNLILKGDVQGSVEAILGSLRQLPQNEVQVRVLFAAPGEITETDVDLAAASGAVIIGFNTALANGARQAADREGVDVREYNIIYKLLDDIQGAMEGLLEPEQVEEPLGQLEVRAVFKVGRGAVAGCYVQSGKAVRNCNIRVKRGGKVVYTGILDSLKRMKEDTKEVATGFECGIGLDKFNDWAEGDIIETFTMVTKRRTLSPV